MASGGRLVVAYTARIIKLLIRDDSLRLQATVAGVPIALIGVGPEHGMHERDLRVKTALEGGRGCVFVLFGGLLYVCMSSGRFRRPVTSFRTTGDVGDRELEGQVVDV